MKYLLDLGYGLLVLVFSPWLLYSAVRKSKYREGFAEKFGVCSRWTAAAKPKSSG